MSKMFQYEPYGPFKVPLESGRISKNLKKFWEEVDTQKSGLPEAVGCYIFAVKRASASIPFYVGKTVRLGFNKEVFQPSKELQVALLGTLENGDVELYLIPRVTNTGKPRGKYGGNVRQSHDGKIAMLEELLIGLALAKNPDLGNVKGRKQIQLPGVMNESGERRSPDADRLAALLGIAEQKAAYK